MVRMAQENRDWGYRRIAAILERHGMEPAPERSRKTTWKEFLSRHWEMIVATDFFTVEVWTRRGLQRFMVLFFIDLSTRKVEVAGIGPAPDGLWMTQIARNLTAWWLLGMWALTVECRCGWLLRVCEATGLP